MQDAKAEKLLEELAKQKEEQAKILQEQKEILSKLKQVSEFLYYSKLIKPTSQDTTGAEGDTQRA
jgi:hypothetical protein